MFSRFVKRKISPAKNDLPDYHQPWITPSIFDNTNDSRIVDEYTFGQYQDRSKAASTLQRHWDTWITEADFAAIAAAGLNHVRLPIGYWAFDVSGGEPYVQGQVPYLLKAVTWAQNHGLKLIVDLHGKEQVSVTAIGNLLNWGFRGSWKPERVRFSGFEDQTFF